MAATTRTYEKGITMGKVKDLTGMKFDMLKAINKLVFLKTDMQNGNVNVIAVIMFTEIRLE